MKLYRTHSGPQPPSFEMLTGDVLEVLRTLPDQSVHTAVTSPPYYGKRDYGTGTWEGGNPECKHKLRLTRRTARSTLSGSTASQCHEHEGFRLRCKHCGAGRIDSQIGLEGLHDCLSWATGTPCGACYICRLVQVFAELRRVLRDDGTLWVNLGDSYAVGEGRGYRGEHADKKRSPGMQPECEMNRMAMDGLKPKDLCGMPFRFFLAMQRAGWWTRRDVIWEKPQPLPESAHDRPTTAHEYVFLFSKSRRYFYDRLAVMEPVSGGAKRRDGGSARGGHTPKGDQADHDTTRANSRFHLNTRALVAERNLRSVWRLGAMPTSEPHYATYPIELPERCIKASTPEAGVCPECGAPWTRVLKRQHYGDWHPDPDLKAAGINRNGNTEKTTQMSGAKFDASEREMLGTRMKANTARARDEGADHDAPFLAPVTIGWKPGCACGQRRYRAADFEIIESPAGKDGAEDPTLETGRAGLNRARREGAGRRPMTRYEQREYARQLKELDGELKRELRKEAGGRDTFAHYTRTDRSGARAIPPDLLEQWIERGHLLRVDAPLRDSVPLTLKPVPAVVLDPFAGMATTGLAALKLGRRFIGIDLSEHYTARALHRARRLYPLTMEAPIEPGAKRKRYTDDPIYRTEFEQPLAVINPLGVRVPGPITVEVYRAGRTRWAAREASSRANFRLVRGTTAEEARKQAALLFERQLTEWSTVTV